MQLERLKKTRIEKHMIATIAKEIGKINNYTNSFENMGMI